MAEQRLGVSCGRGGETDDGLGRICESTLDPILNERTAE